ncbi:MAG TPA: LytTR family DNA-binding domain-containing protein, partial [Thermoanaerobaculia bacterium]|nr:LytTR family DNA-binding domain-containing protein [Thermoanaerobaculia bacterium]
SVRTRALIAEDEAPARESLREYLAAAPAIEIVAEAVDGRTALALADEHAPDLLFLDVRLPELSGLEVARRIRHRAEIVFTTAYDRFAVAAFEIGAIDYLVKPFGRERLAAAVERALARLGQAAVGAGDRARDSLADGPVARLFARQGDRIVPIAASGIRRIQAQGDYAEVHAAEGTFLIHVALAELAARLDPARFRQVHRSHIVNLDAVAHMRAHDDRRLAITLRDGSVVVASRTASEELRKLAR